MKRVIISFFAFIWSVPFLMMLLIAINEQNTNSVNGMMDPSQFGLENFKNAWIGASFSKYFLNTIIVTVVSVLLILIITSLAGYVMGHFDFKSKKWLLRILVFSMGIPTIFYTIPVYQLLKMMQVNNSLVGLIMAEIGGGHLIFVLLFSNFFKSIPHSLEESALIDGANEFQVFYRIMLPLSKPVIGTVVITQSIWTWNSFLYPLILSINNPEIRTLSVGLYSFQGENIVEWGNMAAGACITIVPMVCLFLLFQRYFIQGISGAVKE